MSSINNILKRLRESRIDEASPEYRYKFSIPWRLELDDDEGIMEYQYDPKEMEYLDDLVVKAKTDFNEENIAQFTDEDIRTKDCGIKSMTMDFDDDYKCIIEVITSIMLDSDQIEDICDYLTGQMADGWGEGFEQREIASYKTESEEWIEDEEFDEGGYYDTIEGNVYVYGQFYWSPLFVTPYAIKCISTPQGPTNEASECGINEDNDEPGDYMILKKSYSKSEEFDDRDSNALLRDLLDRLESSKIPYQIYNHKGSNKCEVFYESSNKVISVSIDEYKLQDAMHKKGYEEDEVFEFIKDIYGLEDGEDFQVGNGFDFLFYADTEKKENIEKFKDELGEAINESFRDTYYISVEYTYNGDEVSDYLGHVKVRTDKEDVALKAAEKYAMDKHPEDEPRHFNISKDDYTNVDVVDDRGDFLTHLEEDNSGSAFKVGDVVEWSGLYGGSYTGKVKDIKDDKITLTVSWTSEDDGRLVQKDSNYKLEKDDEGNDVFIVWEYRGHKGYVYPPNSSLSEAIPTPSDNWLQRDNSDYHKEKRKEEETHPYVGKDVIWKENSKYYKIDRAYDGKDGVVVRCGNITMKPGEYVIKESEDTEMDAQEILVKLKDAVKKYMMSPAMGFPEDEVEDYSRVDVEFLHDNEYGNNLRVEVRAELGYVALSNLGDELNKIIYKYDEDAYFEPEQPGILVAYLSV